MSEAHDLVSGFNPVDQWAKPPPIAMAPDLQAGPVQPPPAQAGAPDAMAPKNPAAEVASFYSKEFGLPPQVGAGIARYMQTRESGLDPAAYNPDDKGSPSAGIAQWHGPRLAALERQPGADTLQGQLQFSAQELRGPEKATLDALRHAKTDQDAFDIWKTSYERPAEFKQGFGWANDDRARHTEAFGSDSGLYREYMRLAGEETPGSTERVALLHKAQEASERATESFEELRKTPPYYKPVDIMENFGSAAVLIGVIGGLFAKRPLMASLNAAGLAMQAQQQQNFTQFKAASDQWKTQAEMGLQQARLAHDQIREVMEDERLAENEKQARLQNVMSGLHFTQQQQQQWQNHTDKMLLASQAAQDRAQREKDRMEQHFDRMAQLHEAQRTREASTPLPQQYVETLDEQWRQANPGKELPAEVHLENIKKAQTEGGKKSSGGGLETSKMFDVLDDKDNVVRTVMARERRDQAGFMDSDTGEPIKLDKDKGEHLRQITPTSTGGGRAGAQVLRQQIGGREVLSDLQNAVRLPVGTTIGPLGTVHTGPGIFDAVRGDLVRKMTDQESQLMQASMASMTRELSILMSPVYGGNWAAQQIDPLVPKTGDTLSTVMFKMSRLAQSADNALEAVSKSPILSNEQKKYAIDLKTQINEAVPWSPGQAMDFALRHKGEHESFGDFVKAGKLDSSGVPPAAAEALKAHPDKKDEFDAKFGAGSAARVLGQ